MSGGYLDDTTGGEAAEACRPVWEDEPDESAPPASTTPRPRRPSATGPAEADWLAPEAALALLVPVCDAQDALARLDSRAAVAPAPIREGLNARIAFAEAAGWLAFAHAWVDPRDLALKDLGLTGSYAIATRIGRPLRDLPNTYARARRVVGRPGFSAAARRRYSGGDRAHPRARCSGWAGEKIRCGTLPAPLRRSARSPQNPSTGCGSQGGGRSSKKKSDRQTTPV